MRIYHFIIFLSVGASVKAQTNLVPNPGFENVSDCPTGASSFVQTELTKALGWYQPSEGTTDLFSTCSSDPYNSVPQNYNGYQDPRMGTNYIGLLASYVDFSFNDLDYREYAAIKLVQPLEIGTRYFISFYVSLGDSINYTTDKIGAHFQVDSNFYPTQDNIPITPIIENFSGNFITNKTGWTKISGSFVADSMYQYFLIGNFRNGVNTPRQFVSGGGSSAPIEYEQTFFYIDDICVSEDSAFCHSQVSVYEHTNNHVKLFPNPSKGVLNIAADYSEYLHIRIFNLSGKKVWEDNIWSGIQIDLSELKQGTYIIEITNEENKFYDKLVLY